ncbi:MAG: MFS transporter [Alphaproteobacteria bacterium]|nr:MFS transporter [Alphaproteobacteria bacterium]
MQPPQPQDGLPQPQRRRAMATMALAICVSVLGSSVANVALPTIARDLAVTPAASVWVVNAFQIAVMVALIPCSSLGDIYGYRRVYGIGLAVFTAASLACSLVDSLPMMIAARIVQGLGGAGLMSVNTALIRFIFPRSMLGRGMGFNTLVVATSSALGPTVAAAVLSVASWHWLFAINVPIGLAALAMLRDLPVTPRAGHTFDIPSAILNAATFGLLIATLDSIGYGGGFWLPIAEIVALAVVGTLFVRRMLRLPAPMLPVDLFRRPVFALSVATSISSFIAQSGAYVALPFLLQSVGGMSDAGTGLLMTPWPATIAIIAPFAGRLSDRFSAGLMGGIGLAIMTCGMLAVGLLPEHPAWWDVAWRMSMAGAGFALFQAPNNRLLISSVPRERSGAGSGMLSTSRLLGQSMGAAMVAICFSLTEGSGVAHGAVVAVFTGAAFAAIATVLSSLRMIRTARD